MVRQRVGQSPTLHLADDPFEKAKGQSNKNLRKLAWYKGERYEGKHIIYVKRQAGECGGGHQQKSAIGVAGGFGGDGDQVRVWVGLVRGVYGDCG